MAEQLFSFLIALELYLKSKYSVSDISKHFYKRTIPIITIISIISGVFNGIDYYSPGCVQNSISVGIFYSINSVFFLIVFTLNMVLFIMFFVNSRKVFTKSSNDSYLSVKQELILYILFFLTVGILRAPLYIISFISNDVILFLYAIVINTSSAVLVPLLFSWNFGHFTDYKNWIKSCCKCNDSVKKSNEEDPTLPTPLNGEVNPNLNGNNATTNTNID